MTDDLLVRGIVLDHEQTFAGELRLRHLPSRLAHGRGGVGENGEMKRGSPARIALDPDAAAH